jgi:hypothetical protein
MCVIDDARGMSRCSASAIPTGGMRRVQTPSDRQRDFENVAFVRFTVAARPHAPGQARPHPSVGPA